MSDETVYSTETPDAPMAGQITIPDPDEPNDPDVEQPVDPDQPAERVEQRRLATTEERTIREPIDNPSNFSAR